MGSPQPTAQNHDQTEGRIYKLAYAIVELRVGVLAATEVEHSEMILMSRCEKLRDLVKDVMNYAWYCLIITSSIGLRHLDSKKLEAGNDIPMIRSHMYVRSRL
jgi:hypothetical protein